MERIIIAAAGDFCPTEHVEAKMREILEPEKILGGAVECFKKADLSIANLEYPLTLKNKKLVKYGSHTKGHPDSLNILKRAGIDIVTIANNHILDYGEEGLVDTIRFCREIGIDAIGAGTTLNEAQKIYFKEIKGKKIAIIAFCENEYSVANTTRGGACPMDIIGNYNQIKEAKKSADIIIVVVHGGNEFSHFPNPRIIKQYRFYVDCGASAVIAHHPHYIQGYEIYKNSPILYSLGKLIYTRMNDPYILESPIAVIKFDAESLNCKVEFKFFKTDLNKTQLIEITGPNLVKLKSRFQYYCYALNNAAIINEEWSRYCLNTELKAQYFYTLLAAPRLFYRLARRLKMLRAFPSLMKLSKNRSLYIKDLFSCESHRDAILKMLDDICSGIK